MDRPARFSHQNSVLYQSSLRTNTTASTGGESIKLDDLYEWTRRKDWPRRRESEDVGDWRKGATITEDELKTFSEVTIEKETWPGRGRQGSVPEPRRFDDNFLHPATPNRNSFPLPPANTHADDHEPADLPRRMTNLPGANINKTSKFGWWPLLLLLLTAIMVVLTAIYANGTAKPLMQDRFFSTSSPHTILILRILTEGCALLFAALVVMVVEDLQWALASRPSGVSLLHFVGLDSGTGVWGLLRLLATADWNQKYSSLFRLMIICMIPLPGIVLMGDVSLELIFFPQHTYNVTAGIAEFDVSYISDVSDTIKTAMLIQMGSTTWSAREAWTPSLLGPSYGNCTVSDTDRSWSPCDEAHLLMGGVMSISPQSDDLTTYLPATAYVVPKTRSLHLEYGTVHDIDGLYNNGTCYTIGGATAAAYWCASTGKDQELLFGSSYCPLAVQSQGRCLNDTDWKYPLQIASSLFVYKRYATVNYDRGNFSILSVRDLTPPERQIVALEDYMTAMSAVVPGFGSTNSSSTGDNSALAMYAVTALPLNDNQIAKQISKAAIRKAMAVPFNYFHANYFNAQSIWELKTPRDGLAGDMYTTLSLSVMSYQVIAGGVSRWLFGLLSGILLALSAVVIVVTSRICERRPQRCGYPTLDFAAVCAAKSGAPRSPSSRPSSSGTQRGVDGLLRSLTSLGQTPTPFQVASRIKNERIVLGR